MNRLILSLLLFSCSVLFLINPLNARSDTPLSNEIEPLVLKKIRSLQIPIFKPEKKTINTQETPIDKTTTDLPKESNSATLQFLIEDDVIVMIHDLPCDPNGIS